MPVNNYRRMAIASCVLKTPFFFSLLSLNNHVSPKQRKEERPKPGFMAHKISAVFGVDLWNLGQLGLLALNT